MVIFLPALLSWLKKTSQRRHEGANALSHSSSGKNDLPQDLAPFRIIGGCLSVAGPVPQLILMSAMICGRKTARVKL